VQYLAGGPCVDAVKGELGIEVRHDDLLDEASWQLFAQATAARAVRSTLTLLLTREGRVIGSVNLYAASDKAFEGHHVQLAQIVGASAASAVANADLSFTTRGVAEQAPARIIAQTAVDTAAGMIAEMMKVEVDEAALRLQDAARRAGISVERFAEALVKLHSSP
jgi:GAF domain-containing protein